jgi:hypothetical protein
VLCSRPSLIRTCTFALVQVLHSKCSIARKLDSYVPWQVGLLLVENRSQAALLHKLRHHPDRIAFGWYADAEERHNVLVFQRTTREQRSAIH